MINGIHHTAISTANLDRIVGFYRDVVGFEVVSDTSWEKGSEIIDQVIGLKDSSARSVMMRAGNAYLEFFQYETPTPKANDPKRPPSDHGYTHICLDVTDIEAEYERLTKAGMTFNCRPPKFEGMGLRAVYGRDLDGNIVEIQETITDQAGFSLSKLPLLQKAV